MKHLKQEEESALTAQQDAAIALLVTGSTVSDAAEVLSLRRRTIEKWKSTSSKFRAKLKRVKDKISRKKYAA